MGAPPDTDGLSPSVLSNSWTSTSPNSTALVVVVAKAEARDRQPAELERPLSFVLPPLPPLPLLLLPRFLRELCLPRSGMPRLRSAAAPMAEGEVRDA